MKRNGKLSASLHALVHMAERPERPMTSEEIASWLNTNPVVVRRMVAGLRDAGILSSARGHGGGWTLARPAETILAQRAETILTGSALAKASARPAAAGPSSARDRRRRLPAAGASRTAR